MDQSEDMAGEKDLTGGESASGRVDILAKRIAERLVSKTGNLAVIGAYAQVQPLTDAVIDHYLGGLTLEDLAIEGAGKVVNGARKVKKRVVSRVRKKRRAKRKSGAGRSAA